MNSDNQTFKISGLLFQHTLPNNDRNKEANDFIKRLSLIFSEHGLNDDYKNKSWTIEKYQRSWHLLYNGTRIMPGARYSYFRFENHEEIKNDQSKEPQIKFDVVQVPHNILVSIIDGKGTFPLHMITTKLNVKTFRLINKTYDDLLYNNHNVDNKYVTLKDNIMTINNNNSSNNNNSNSSNNNNNSNNNNPL